MLDPAPLRQKIARRLKRWYSLHQRDLPWRRTNDPYKIWVSEVMLQQTQVATVIPYYRKWLRRFPTLVSLARAPLNEVLRYWAGLGYYRRARMFHQAARYVQKKMKGKIPETAEGLCHLPGIGRYTAGAIASIAFGQRAPVLDGNVIRVLTRIFGIAQDIARLRTLEKLWNTAASLLPEKDPGDMNQAMMELGATVCFPRDPRCPQCPVRTFCKARQRNKPDFYPVHSQKENYEKIEMTALVPQNDRGDVWIERQHASSRWGGLWMFPFWNGRSSMIKEIGEFRTRLQPLMIVRHGYTKYRITLTVHKARIPKGKKSGKFLMGRKGRWVPLQRIKLLAFPAPHQQIVNALTAKHAA
ncbi:MAG: A/G-specific adenine glycosylase [Candidatus Omnitrophica bacterium]|nr:A/G-specific adenine glycosylase [Candidatus Omnitrophota bacterium]